MKRFNIYSAALILSSLLLLSFSPALYAEEGVLFFEGFDSLEDWRPFFFKKIKEHTTYTAEKLDGESVLRAFSNASASALLFRKTFDVYEYPRVRWRWKITKVYEKGDARIKSGDDYPVRIYINFLYDDDMATLGENILYKAAKAFYGEYPPLRSLNYVWANRAHGKRMLKSPYTSRTMLVILRSGPEGAGEWFTEEINILEDYRKAFGAEPPRMVNIAVMNDSDDTGESSTSYFDFIEVLK